MIYVLDEIYKDSWYGKMRIVTFGKIISAISAVLACVIALTPDRVENLKLDFVIFILKHLTFEIILCLIFGLVITIPVSIWKKLYKELNTFFTVKLKPLSENNKVDWTIIGITLIVAIIFIGASFSEAFYVLRARKYFTMNLLYQAYEQDLIREAINYEKNNHILKAITVYRRMVKSFPDRYTMKRAKEKIRRLNSIMKYKQDIALRVKKLYHINGLKRQCVFLAAESLRIYPCDINMNRLLKGFISEIETTILKTAENLYDECTIGDQMEAFKLYNSLGKYIFEAEILRDIDLRASKKSNGSVSICFICDSLSKEQFLETIIDSWQLENIKTISKRSDNLIEAFQ